MTHLSISSGPAPHARRAATERSRVPLARCVAWMADEPCCANEGFNVVNGDNPRWSDLWPRFAAEFGMRAAEPRNVKLGDYMADKSAIWESAINKHGLRPTQLETIALWPYGDYLFRPEWDIQSSMAKASALGFAETLDSGTMFAQHFTQYRAAQIIP